MKALITGGTGFIGSHLARELANQGHEVRVLRRHSSKLIALKGIPHESAFGDILDSAALRAACLGCEWVFHVAAVADYWRSDQAKMFEANVEGTRRVLAAAQEAGVRRVIFTSSAAAVGLLPDGTPADESSSFNLRPDEFPYGYSKHLAEGVVRQAVANGQDVVTVNPVIVLGPGDLNMISGSFLTQVKQFGRLTPITLSGGVGVVDVRDVARWQVCAAEQGVCGERYILGAANIPNREWYNLIADTVGVGHPMIFVPAVVLPLVSRVIAFARRLGVETPVDADQVKLSGRKVYFAYDKAWSAFGKPRYDIATSLQDTYEWYQAHGFIR